MKMTVLGTLAVALFSAVSIPAIAHPNANRHAVEMTTRDGSIQQSTQYDNNVLREYELRDGGVPAGVYFSTPTELGGGLETNHTTRRARPNR